MQEVEPLRSLIRGELEKVRSLTLAENEPGGVAKRSDGAKIKTHVRSDARKASLNRTPC